MRLIGYTSLMISLPRMWNWKCV